MINQHVIEQLTDQKESSPVFRKINNFSPSEKRMTD